MRNLVPGAVIALAMTMAMTAAMALAASCAGPRAAPDVDATDRLVRRARLVYALKLYDEAGPTLVRRLTGAGETPAQADYLALLTSLKASDCALRHLAARRDGPAPSFVELLARKDDWRQVSEALASFPACERRRLMDALSDATVPCMKRAYGELRRSARWAD